MLLGAGAMPPLVPVCQGLAEGSASCSPSGDPEHSVRRGWTVGISVVWPPAGRLKPRSFFLLGVKRSASKVEPAAGGAAKSHDLTGGRLNVGGGVLRLLKAYMSSRMAPKKK